MKWPWNKKRLSNEYVELSIGKIYLYEITNGMLNEIFIKSMHKGELNNALFLGLFDFALVPLSKRQVNNLSLKDGDLLRKKVKSILIKNDILKPVPVEIEDDANIFSETDTQWFNTTAMNGIQKAMGSR